MQQYYGLDLWSMGLDGDETTDDVLRAAVLVAHLPAGSRLSRAIDADAAWGPTEWLLRSVDFRLQNIAALVARSKVKPKAAETPSERSRKAERIESAAARKSMIDEILFGKHAEPSG